MNNPAAKLNDGIASQAQPQQKAMATVDVHQAAILSWMEDIAPYGIFTTDIELNIQSWNEWLETHSGVAVPMAIGKPLFELFPDLSERKMDEHFRRALAGEIIVLSAAFHEYLLPFPSTLREGASRHMQQTARIAPLSYSGQLCGTITIIEDVSQREFQAAALARRHERDQLLSSCLGLLLRTRNPESVVNDVFSRVADHLGVHTFLNYLLEEDGTHLRLHAGTGIPENVTKDFERVCLGETLFGVAAADRRLIVANYLQASASPQTAHLKALGFRAAVCNPLVVGDRLMGALAFATRNRDAFRPEDIEFIVTVSQYIAVAIERTMTETALQEAQQKLKIYAQNLETKVQERTAVLEDTVTQLESFSYTVAHDLRAPIRALKGYAEMLVSEKDPPGPEKSRNYLLRLGRAADRLDVLTRDLLQFSSVSRQEIQTSNIDLEEMVQDLRVLRPMLHEEVLTVKQPLDPVLANRTLLQQCLSNLFDNAVKFVAAGIKPRIVLWTERIQASESKPLRLHPVMMNSVPMPAGLRGSVPLSNEEGSKERIRIWIEDNGIGIAKESRNKIFGIFERLNPADKYEGTGIGLAIVARAMQRMGGNCGVESGEIVGSRFWLDLPPATETLQTGGEAEQKPQQ